jgi:hypothetical protein
MLLVIICVVLVCSIMLHVRAFLQDIANNVHGIYLFFIYLLLGLNIFNKYLYLIMSTPAGTILENRNKYMEI